MIPGLRLVAADQRIDGASVKVYLYLVTDELDLHKFKPVKVSSVANALHMRDVTVWRALKRLTGCGYLAQGRRIGRCRSYRVVWNHAA